jgi:hypothetical protein
MKVKEASQGYSFSITSIQLIEKQLSFPPKRDKVTEFDFDISLNITTNREKKQSIHFMNVTVTTKEDKKKVGSLSMVCFFQIDEFDTILVQEENEIRLPQDLIYLLNTVVIGTARGVMYSEFRGTFLDEAYLPVLDPRQFQKKEDNN